MKTSLLALTLTALVAVSASPASAQSRAEEDRWEAAQRRFDNERALYQRERERYEAAVRRDEEYRRDDYRSGDDYSRYETDYDAARDYRDGPQYRERVLTAEDEVYRGSDGRYYCRRSDGTTGLIIGGAVGGILGNVIDGGRRRTGGTLIGGALGALLGRGIERNQPVRCR